MSATPHNSKFIPVVSFNNRTTHYITKSLTESLRTLTLFSFLTIALCLAGLNNSHADSSQRSFLQSYAGSKNIKSNYIPIVYQAEQNSSSAGKAVLVKARNMALDKRTLVLGSCWDYLNAVFNRAGVKREIIFKGSKHGGRYISVNKIQPGDWLYFINHSYRGSEHSGMFVGWVDKSRKEALIYSYVGGNRRVPARYSTYKINNVYHVIRPKLSNQNSVTKTTQNSTLPSPTIQKAETHHNSNLNIDEMQSSHQKNNVNEFKQRYQYLKNIKNSHIPILYQSEKQSSAAAQSVLKQGRIMTLDQQEIIAGSSQNYVKAVFQRADINYKNLFIGDYYGKFIDPHKVQSGDWLSYINHSYKESEHTGIFIGWTNKSKNKALILSYGGEGRQHPARYREYDISHIYHIRRPI